MPFIQVPGLPGKVYVPQTPKGQHKHPCPDCFDCQRCSDDRCQVCKSQPAPCRMGQPEAERRKRE